jgi:hypothetical protein
MVDMADAVLKGGGGVSSEPTVASGGEVVGKNYLMLIGINEYTSVDSEGKNVAKPIGKLNNCERDVEAVQRVLEDRFGFTTIKKLLGPAAKKVSVESAILKFKDNIIKDKQEKGEPATSIENDTLLFMFSGHGVTVGNSGFWLPFDSVFEDDSTYIDVTILLRWLQKWDEARHIVLIIDCCFPDSIFSNGLARPSTGLDNPKSRWAIASGRNVPVPDGYPGQNSPFAKFLIEILENCTQPLILDNLGFYWRDVEVDESFPRCQPLMELGHGNGVCQLVPIGYDASVPDAEQMKDALFDIPFVYKETTDEEGYPVSFDLKNVFKRVFRPDENNLAFISLQGQPNSGHLMVAKSLFKNYVGDNKNTHNVCRPLTIGAKNDDVPSSVWDSLATLFPGNDEKQIAEKLFEALKADKILVLLLTPAEGVKMQEIYDQVIAFWREFQGYYEKNAEQITNKLFIFLLNTGDGFKPQTPPEPVYKAACMVQLPEIPPLKAHVLKGWKGELENKPPFSKPRFKALGFDDFKEEEFYAVNAVKKICDLFYGNSKLNPYFYIIH